MFKDRKDAAQKLILSLKKFKADNPIVLAIPRGGAEIGFEIAKALDVDFSIIISRKLPFPSNPEAGFGAIAEDGSTFIFKEYLYGMNEKLIEQIKKDQQDEIIRRKLVLRKNRPLPDIEGRMVIIVDDGIAMGSTMRATIKLCKKKNPKKIVVAVPVAGRKVAIEMKDLVDEFIVLTIPPDFHAVAQVYETWYDVPDLEVIKIMDKVSDKKKKDKI